MKLILIFLLCICGTFTIDAQKNHSDQSHAWVMYFGNHRLSEHWGIHTEYQWRRADFFESWQQSLMRVGADFYVKDHMFTLGYGWIKTFQYGEFPVSHDFNEHRIWEQWIMKNQLYGIKLQHRFRLEQRFLENWQKNTNGDFERGDMLFRQRIRYRFLANIPLTRKEFKDNTLFLSVYDEVFLGFGKGIGKNVMDQNRLYFALGWWFNPNFNVQLGYMNQYVIKPNATDIERNHTLQIWCTYNLDFRKKQ